MRGLDRRRVLVTGAAGAGIGSAMVRRLAAEGCRVIATDADARRLARLRDELAEAGVTIEAHELDVADGEAVERVLAAAGPLDGLVASAAINELARVDRLREEDWQRVIDVDLSGVWRVCRAALGPMRDRGSGVIVALSSAAIYSGEFSAGASAYSAAKAGVAALVRAIATEAGPDGVRANAIAPGIVDSPFVRANAERFAAEAERTPLRRFARPDEIASLAAFLLSDEASFISGETIVASGGRLSRA